MTKTDLDYNLCYRFLQTTLNSAWINIGIVNPY